ncbi:CARDB domain-containing protein [Halorarius litoreus]|uniref:CARDB domain-containing protein n=1 Tax=Halorarius litoreus TaxID=2962676 RepID=UPI0020CD371F|nr:CARDB domain-containing protein [Halorarius litoreus]
MRRLLVALVALVVVAGTGGLVAAQSTATVGVDAPGSVTSGQSTSGALVVTDVTDPEGVGSFTVNVTYDPSVVTVTASGTSTFDVSTSHPEPGVLTVVGYTGQYPGPDGTVTLAGLSISGESTGTSAFDTTVESITDADGNALANTTSSDSITIQQSSSGGSNTGDGGDGSDGGSSAGSSGGSTGGSTGAQTSENGTADLQVVDATLSAREVAPGEPVTVTATVENSGNASGTAELELAIDGTTTGDSRLVEVPAGETRTVSIETSLDATGEYAVSLGGASAGTLSVVEPDTPTATESQPVTPTAKPESPETPTATDTGTPTEGDGPGFGLLAALVALALVALRRR